MNRTVFLVDGLNLYHSLEEASRDSGGAPSRWLDIRALLDSYLPAIGGGAVTTQVVYFSALPTHLESRKPGLTARHRLFPAKRIWLVLPYKRRNNELARLADGYCYIRKERYAQHQWPPTMRLPSGRVVVRPQSW